MPWLFVALRYLHVLAASVWFGAALFWPGAVRRALRARSAAGDASLQVNDALTQARTGLRLDLVAGLFTIAVGGAYAGALGAVRPGIWVGAALALLRLALLLAMARPALAQLSGALAASDAGRAEDASRRLPAYAGAAHLLWLVALATMVIPT